MHIAHVSPCGLVMSVDNELKIQHVLDLEQQKHCKPPPCRPSAPDARRTEAEVGLHRVLWVLNNPSSSWNNSLQKDFQPLRSGAATDAGLRT